MAQIASLYFRRGCRRLKTTSKMLPFILTAACAAGLSSPRSVRLPLGEWLLRVSPSADLLARANSHPGGQSLVRRENLRRRTDLCDDLLGRFHSQTRDFGQSFHCPA